MANATMVNGVHEPIPPSRRDFLYIATATVAAVGAAATAWPLIDQMNPDAETLARGGPLDIDLTPIAVGQQIVVQWQQHPIFIVHRSPEAIKSLKDPQVLSHLRDPKSEVAQQPAYAANWSRSIKEEYLVLVGVCTHLGCVPEYTPKVGSVEGDFKWPGGWFCHCHGSKYDLAGRVFQGVPAPYNLPVPPYHFPKDGTLRIGENPPGVNFDLNNVVQI